MEIVVEGGMEWRRGGWTEKRVKEKELELKGMEER